MIAVIFTAWHQGFRYSVFATFLGFILALTLFIHPLSFESEASVSSISQFGMYFLVCFFIAQFGEATRTTQNKLQQAKEAADYRAEMLRITLASIGDAVITTDVRGNVTYLNSVAESLTAWRNDEAIGLPLETVFQVVNAATREPIENQLLRARNQDATVALANHALLIAKDKSERPVDYRAAPILNGYRAVVGCVLVFHPPD